MKKSEELAFTDIVSKAGSGRSLYETLYQDYEDRHTLEARLVKAADVIDLLIQAYALERAGAKGLDEFWDVVEEADFQLPTEANEVVREVLESIMKARRTLDHQQHGRTHSDD